MRFFVGLALALALSVIGCGEGPGTGPQDAEALCGAWCDSETGCDQDFSDPEDCSRQCREVLALLCGEHMADVLACVIDAECNDEFNDCKIYSDETLQCQSDVREVCEECPICSDAYEETACFTCKNYGGGCDADPNLELCDFYERSGQLECTVEECVGCMNAGDCRDSPCPSEPPSAQLSAYCLDTYCSACSIAPASDEVCLMSCVYRSPSEGPLCEGEVIAVHECELEIGRCFGTILGDPETDERCCEQIEAMDAVSYTHLTLPTICFKCRSRWAPGQ